MSYDGDMARRALEPGEFGKTTMRGKHPKLGLWRSEASLKQEKVRPKLWRAEVRYHDPATHRVRVITAEGETKSGAEEALEEAQRQTKEKEGLVAGSAEVTVERGVKLYLQALEDGDLNLSPGTVRTYSGLIRKHLLSKGCLIRRIPLRRLTALDVERDMDRVVRAGAWSQLRHYRAVMNAVTARAIKARVIEEDPMLRVKMPGRPRTAGRKVYGNGAERRLNRALTADEERALLEQMKLEPPHVADLAIVLLRTGLRMAEAVSLRVQDLDLEAGTITVSGKLVRVRGEGLQWDPLGKNDLSLRTLPLSRDAQEALERRLAHAQSLGGLQYLFTTPRGGKPDRDNYTALLREAFDRAGLKDVTGHTLRRTVERELELAGATVSERETFMGHTERVARKHYADHGAVRPSIITAMEQAREKVE